MSHNVTSCALRDTCPKCDKLIQWIVLSYFTMTSKVYPMLLASHSSTPFASNNLGSDTTVATSQGNSPLHHICCIMPTCICLQVVDNVENAHLFLFLTSIFILNFYNLPMLHSHLMGEFCTSVQWLASWCLVGSEKQINLSFFYDLPPCAPINWQYNSASSLWHTNLIMHMWPKKLCIMHYALCHPFPCFPTWFRAKSNALWDLCIMMLCIMS